MKIELESKFSVGQLVRCEEITQNSWNDKIHIFRVNGVVVDIKENSSHNGFLYLIEKSDKTRRWFDENQLDLTEQDKIRKEEIRKKRILGWFHVGGKQ